MIYNIYNTIIILAMGIKLDVNGEEFEKNNIKIRYKITGDDFLFRFKAAKKLYDQGTRRIFLVGGHIKGVEVISKPDIMEDILIKKYNIPQVCLVKIVSEANTEGNAKAIKEYITNNKVVDNVGLLTNYYHMVRALKDFVNIQELRFIPVVAESIVYNEEFKNICKIYKSDSKNEGSGLKEIVGYLKEQNSEIKGLHDKEFKAYKSGTS